MFVAFTTRSKRLLIPVQDIDRLEKDIDDPDADCLLVMKNGDKFWITCTIDKALVILAKAREK